MLANKLTDLIKVYDDYSTEEECNKIIEVFENHPSLHQRYERGGRPNFTQFNFTEYVDSGKCTQEEKDLHRDLTTVFMNAISLYQIDCSITDEMPPQWGIEQIRIKKYNPSSGCCGQIDEKPDQFAEHVDVGDYNSARRYLAMFLYLNVIEGGSGKTSFPYLNLKVDPIPGRILVFPPMWMYAHAGEPTYQNPKYIVGTYCHYL